MITFALVILAAIFKAVADTLDDHFDTSIFRNRNPLVWDANRSEVGKWWITNYKMDPWHICNSLLIVSFMLAAIFNDLKWTWWVQLVSLGVVYNLVFEWFYSKVLISPK